MSVHLEMIDKGNNILYYTQDFSSIRSTTLSSTGLSETKSDSITSYINTFLCALIFASNKLKLSNCFISMFSGLNLTRFLGHSKSKDILKLEKRLVQNLRQFKLVYYK